MRMGYLHQDIDGKYTLRITKGSKREETYLEPMHEQHRQPTKDPKHSERDGLRRGEVAEIGQRPELEDVDAAVGVYVGDTERDLQDGSRKVPRSEEWQASGGGRETRKGTHKIQYAHQT